MLYEGKKKLEVKCQTCERQNKHENKITFHIFLSLSSVKKRKKNASALLLKSCIRLFLIGVKLENFFTITLQTIEI